MRGPGGRRPLRSGGGPQTLRRVAGTPGAGELAALDALGPGGRWQVHGRELTVTNLGKVLFPARAGEPPVTKREFLAYTATIAPIVLPYLAGRPLNMHRYPNGAGTKGFWHKEVPAHAPNWLPRWDNPEAGPGQTRTYLVVDEPAALVWAANFGALEWHAWTSRADSPHCPDFALIDIDPGPKTAWEDMLLLARLHRVALGQLNVVGQPKLTGRRGIQIWIPIRRGPTFAQTTAWVRQLSRTVGTVVPELVSWKWEVRARSGLARLDYTQNAINKTLVAPYSARPAPGAPVSAPIDWDELDQPGIRSDSFTIRAIGDRITKRGDPFRTLLDTAQDLPSLTALTSRHRACLGLRCLPAVLRVPAPRCPMPASTRSSNGFSLS